MVIPSQIRTLDDVLSAVKTKAGIMDSQTETIDTMKLAIGQRYDQICTERDWHWRVFNRSFVIGPPYETGTSSLTQDSREVAITGFTVSNTYLGKTIRFNNDAEMYRIIGYQTTGNLLLLESSYIGETDASATHKIYEYEFSLPFDCDNIISVSISGKHEIDERNPVEFERAVNSSVDQQGYPQIYSRYAVKLNANSLVPNLGEWVLNYDFLAKEDGEYGDKISFFPISNNVRSKIDIQYTMHTSGWNATETLLIPPTDRWVLVDYALYEYNKSLDRFSAASAYLASAEKTMRKMRGEYKGYSIQPKFCIDAKKLQRTNIVNSNRSYPKITDWEV